MLSARWLVRPKQRLSRQWTALSFHFTHHYAARSAPLQSGLPRSSLFYFHLFSSIFSISLRRSDSFCWAPPARLSCSGMLRRQVSSTPCGLSSGLCRTLPFRTPFFPSLSLSYPLLFPSHSLPSCALFV